jgi:hypothetical protein
MNVLICRGGKVVFISKVEQELIQSLDERTEISVGPYQVRVEKVANKL